jgi:hypothetical protein
MAKRVGLSSLGQVLAPKGEVGKIEVGELLLFR